MHQKILIDKDSPSRLSYSDIVSLKTGSMYARMLDRMHTKIQEEAQEIMTERGHGGLRLASAIAVVKHEKLTKGKELGYDIRELRRYQNLEAQVVSFNERSYNDVHIDATWLYNSTSAPGSKPPPSSQTKNVITSGIPLPDGIHNASANPTNQQLAQRALEYAEDPQKKKIDEFANK